MKDSIKNRFQIEIGGRWQLMPAENMTWRQWAFDPFAGLTVPGQILKDPRMQLPKIRHWVEQINDGIDAETGLRKYHWTSRAFWLRFGVRLFGLDVGFAVAWRKKVA